MADHNRVRPLLFPRSVAVVGASPRHGRIVEEIVRSGIPAWGVHPTRDEVLGLPLFPQRRRPSGAAGARRPPRRARTRRGGLRGGARSGSTRLLPPRPRERGRCRGAGGRRADRGARPRGGRSAARAELHGSRRARGGLALDRDRAGHLSSGPRLGGLAVWVDRRGASRDRPAGRLSLGRLVRRRGGHGRRRHPRLLRGGRGDWRDRALPGDGAPAGRVRVRARALRRGGEAGRLPEGRPLAGGRARRARAHRRGGRLGARVLGASAPARRGRGGRLHGARRDPRGSRPRATSPRKAHRGDLRVRR